MRKLLVPIWIHLPDLPWHYYNWSALQRIVSLNGTLLTIDKANDVKSRPNFAKVKVEVDLVVQLKFSVWAGIKEVGGTERGGFDQKIEQDYVPEYCFGCKHQGHSQERYLKLKNRDDKRDSKKEMQGNRIEPTINSIVDIQTKFDEESGAANSKGKETVSKEAGDSSKAITREGGSKHV